MLKKRSKETLGKQIYNDNISLFEGWGIGKLWNLKDSDKLMFYIKPKTNISKVLRIIKVLFKKYEHCSHDMYLVYKDMYVQIQPTAHFYSIKYFNPPGKNKIDDDGVLFKIMSGMR